MRFAIIPNEAVARRAMAGIRNILIVHSAAARIAHVNALKSQLAELQQYVADAETGQRGFLPTGDERDLEPYHAAAGKLAPALSHNQTPAGAD